MRIQAVLILQPGKWKHHLPRLVTQECLEWLLNREATSVNVCFCEKQLISTYCITYINVLAPITRCTNIRIAIDIYWVNFRPIILSAENKYKSWMEWQACWNFWSPQLHCWFCLMQVLNEYCKLFGTFYWTTMFTELWKSAAHFWRYRPRLVFPVCFRRIWPLNVYSV